MVQTLKSLSVLIVICISAFTSSNSFADQDNFTVKSTILKEQRKIRVHLPDNYDINKDQKFPVIYMLDAGNDDQLAADTAKKLASERAMPPVIIVAIENIRRGYDFTPNYLKMGRGDNRRFGNGDNFLKFITDELMFRVDQDFKTNKTQYFMGHSWGGAFTSYVLSQRPELFEGFFIFSPSFINIPSQDQVKDTLSMDFIKHSKANKSPSFIYLSVGNKERQRFTASYDGFKKFLGVHAHKKTRVMTQLTLNADHMANPELSIPNAFRLAFSKGK